MSDPLTDLIYDIDHNGVRVATLITIYALYRKERRSHYLDLRDKALFQNLKIIMEDKGLGECFVENPNLNKNMEEQLLNSGLTALSHVLPVKSFMTLKVTDQSISRRKNMLTTILKANLSKKLISALVAMAIVALNSYLNLNINPTLVWGVLGLSASHITGQTIIDSIKAWALSKATTIVQTLPTVDDVVQKAIADPVGTHQDAVEIANSFIKTFNSVISNLKRNDNSLDYAESKSFLAELKVIEARYKPLEPLTTIPEQKVSA